MTFFLSLGDTKNQDTQRKRLNRLYALYAPDYGSALPSASAYPSGKLFYVGSQGYQNRSNTWVAL